MVPGHVGTKSKEELRRSILDVTLDCVIDNLTSPPAAGTDRGEPGPHDIIFKGDFKAVNEFFYDNELSDGLPIVPPTRKDIEAFLRFTDRAPDEMLGVLPCDNRAATVWNVAVNGVMAGCRPEYMPILIALVKGMADPEYGVEHSGNTPGGETLIIVNGPITKQLKFNYTQGALRDGFVANTSIGRFWRLCLRNVAGFLPHKTDKATYGNTWRVVLAENEDVLEKIGWEPNNVEMGFATADNTVTIARYTGSGTIAAVSGDTPELIMPYLTESLLKHHSWHYTFAVSFSGTLRPLLVISPLIAETIAAGGWSKGDVKRYLFNHARLPAWEFERQLRDWNLRGLWNLEEEARLGHIPKVFHKSDDPQRLVPIVWKPEDFMIAVTGDPLRNNAIVFAHAGYCGYPVGKEIELPGQWNALLAMVQTK